MAEGKRWYWDEVYVPGDEDTGIPGAWLKECPDCGALVVNIGLHNGWHDKEEG